MIIMCCFVVVLLLHWRPYEREPKADVHNFIICVSYTVSLVFICAKTGGGGEGEPQIKPCIIKPANQYLNEFNMNNRRDGSNHVDF